LVGVTSTASQHLHREPDIHTFIFIFNIFVICVC